MNRKLNDDLTPQATDTELPDHDAERDSSSTSEPGSGQHSARERMPLQEFDEGVYSRERDPWARSDERDDGELSTNFGERVPQKKSKAKRRLVSAVALLFITIGCVGVLYYTFSPSRSVKISLKTKQPVQAQDATAKTDKAPDDVTAEAIAEVRSAMSNPPASAAQSTGASSVLPPSTQNATAAMTSTVLPPDTAEKSPDVKQHETSAHEENRRNREQSLRFANDNEQPAMQKATLKSQSNGAVAAQLNKTPPELSPVTNHEVPRSSRPSFVASRNFTAKPSAAPVVLPSFGSVLPVRTLGKIYTLRSGSSIRLELTRYVSGDGWSLAKGAVLIGQVRGSERDRAFIAITGFIDPARDRFVNLNGEVLGDDGGSGIRGKFHKLSNGWSRAFARVGSAAVNVAGAIAGSRVSGQPVIITDVGSRTISPVSYDVDSSLLNQARGFVEVPAGTPGFVMVTTLPADVKGVDAEPDHLAEASDALTASANQSGALTPDELAQLLTSGDTTRIREALPRMSPPMRRLAETVLAESSQKQTDK